jgi:hypothetical protein
VREIKSRERRACSMQDTNGKYVYSVSKNDQKRPQFLDLGIDFGTCRILKRISVK